MSDTPAPDDIRDDDVSKDEYDLALEEGIEDETLLENPGTKKFSISSYGADYTVDSLVKRMKGGAFKIRAITGYWRCIIRQRHARPASKVCFGKPKSNHRPRFDTYFLNGGTLRRWAAISMSVARRVGKSGARVRVSPGPHSSADGWGVSMTPRGTTGGLRHGLHSGGDRGIAGTVAGQPDAAGLTRRRTEIEPALRPIIHKPNLAPAGLVGNPGSRIDLIRF
jgi:hypothetical protein